MVSAYPNALRTWTKISTPVCFAFVIMNLIPIMGASMRYKTEEHQSKPNHKSDFIERHLRNRDEKIRQVENHFFRRQFGHPHTKRVF